MLPRQSNFLIPKTYLTPSAFTRDNSRVNLVADFNFKVSKMKLHRSWASTAHLTLVASAAVVLFGCQTMSRQNLAPSSLYNGNIGGVSDLLLNGTAKPLHDYLGQVILVSNLSLKCGTTPQIGALEKLFLEYKDRGFVVLGFPSNSFTGEDLSNFDAVANACATRFNVTFPLFAPGPVRGSNIRPFFQFLTTSGPEGTQGDVTFNLEKFLIDRSGRVRYRFGSFTPASSDELRGALEILLQEKGRP